MEKMEPIDTIVKMVMEKMEPIIVEYSVLHCGECGITSKEKNIRICPKCNKGMCFNHDVYVDKIGTMCTGCWERRCEERAALKKD